MGTHPFERRRADPAHPQQILRAGEGSLARAPRRWPGRWRGRSREAGPAPPRAPGWDRCAHRPRGAGRGARSPPRGGGSPRAARQGRREAPGAPADHGAAPSRSGRHSRGGARRRSGPGPGSRNRSWRVPGRPGKPPARRPRAAAQEWLSRRGGGIAGTAPVCYHLTMIHSNNARSMSAVARLSGLRPSARARVASGCCCRFCVRHEGEIPTAA